MDIETSLNLAFEMGAPHRTQQTWASLSAVADEIGRTQSGVHLYRTHDEGFIFAARESSGQMETLTVHDLVDPWLKQSHAHQWEGIYVHLTKSDTQLGAPYMIAGTRCTTCGRWGAPPQSGNNWYQTPGGTRSSHRRISQRRALADAGRQVAKSAPRRINAFTWPTPTPSVNAKPEHGLSRLRRLNPQACMCEGPP